MKLNRDMDHIERWVAPRLSDVITLPVTNDDGQENGVVIYVGILGCEDPNPGQKLLRHVAERLNLDPKPHPDQRLKEIEWKEDSHDCTVIEARIQCESSEQAQVMLEFLKTQRYTMGVK